MHFFETIPKDISFSIILNLVKSRNEIFKDFFTDAAYEQKMIDIVTVAKGIVEKPTVKPD